jgi:hypothetical protein
MMESSVLIDVLVREREAELRALALTRAAARRADPECDRRPSLRERLGLSLIHAGRAMLRHGPAYSTARRRVA